MTTVTLGIDISKAKFDVALLRDGKHKTKQFDNKNTGFKGLLNWLHKKHEDVTSIHFCMEATGSYGQRLATYIANKGYKISVINPAKIKYFGQSELSRNKTDKSDAKLIAKYCFIMSPKTWLPKSQHIFDLQGLVKRAESLQKSLRQEKNRLDTCDSIIKPSIETMLTYITNELKNIKNKIKFHISSHKDLQRKSDLLATIPGVSEVTISWVLAFIGCPKEFASSRQLIAFVGLNPKQRQSGTSINGKTYLSKIGDCRLRKILYMPAISAKQYNPVIKEFCSRLLAAGKCKMVVIGAAMRKLLTIIYGVLKNNQPFDPNWTHAMH